ncbi:DUF397 domain-containing protein [Streptomyces sp. ST2-7A]|uniref:DUF397 domain-containing protein n=1 Tax=Streptomyces sp. ST2-7A TaxID=2907214 RepID=UPI001F2A0A62|nr:DUF397 domain-containing protein [Streptomyces sp. ST2-7A]MCE7083025.1 DUF397 domain-containing protein [Streptomyces sp. ST2-7A]
MQQRVSTWRRSSFCGAGGNNCVEVAATVGGVAVRESEVPGRVVVAEPAAFAALLDAIRAGRVGGPGG